uniref:MHC class I antigen n=1 Tax=Xenopus tropicalis TaxID=8364 RepID=Q6XXY4_XENTR|nr:major histocompatibility complex class I antigen precursor [Xenopus tropicalis]AAI61748.1 major histocompatibility complex class I antigen [Xenopus tropicalis]AAI67634.1 major histocompatibility complex class I antigen [Xenopus tropicalis]AAP36727.1 MHC class I antigen [Xenopus tropicalis]
MDVRLVPLLLTLGVSAVYSGSHSLRYYYTGVSDRAFGLPEFSIVGYVDETQIVRYSSDNGRAEPATQWMKQNEGPEYWDRQTQNSKGTEPVYKHNVKVAMDRFNQTSGTHSLQYMYGCELREDGSTRGYEQFGYDGRELMALDTERWRYVPSMREAQLSTQKWNSPEVNEPERERNYLENICIPALKRYLGYGQAELERRVRPHVKISDHQSDDITELRCQAYGFYPREIDVKWVRNGRDDVHSDEAKEILPNPDGSYQLRVTAKVTPKEGDSYACHVDHSSLEEKLIVVWPGPNKDGKNIVIIIACVAVAVLLIAAAAVGFVLYKKRQEKSGYTETASNESPASSVARA